MNLKERGITIGDLLIVLIIILTSTILVKTFKNDKEKSLNIINLVKISYNENILSNTPQINLFI